LREYVRASRNPRSLTKDSIAYLSENFLNDVVYLTKKQTENTTKTCHRCGYVTQVKGRIFRCPCCGMEYDRDLNACVNIAQRVTSSLGWGSCEQPEPADVVE